jgi:proteasome alpha subunit
MVFEEPYRWVEAVANRRTYLDEQFKSGSPVVALTYSGGILLLTVSRGTPKLYEIYDRLALGGMGHPADLEKLRFSVLEMAHLEGFNRSPSDVTGSRLVKYGLAPTIKQAFEEVFRAPFIVKILLAELGLSPERDALLTINYDGSFEETRGFAVLGATAAVQTDMTAHLKQQYQPGAALGDAAKLALTTWAIGSLAQQTEESEGQDAGGAVIGSVAEAHTPDAAAIDAHLRGALADATIEAAVLERHAPGTSKYRALKPDELPSMLPTLLA